VIASQARVDCLWFTLQELRPQPPRTWLTNSMHLPERIERLGMPFRIWHARKVAFRYWVSLDIHSLALASRSWHHICMTIGKGKRPCDPNQLAKWIVDQSTKEPIISIDPTLHDSTLQPSQPPALMSPETISAYMASIGHKGGQIGGKRRLKTMTKEQRQKVAAKAARTRWRKK
jgi:hypothetical protein